MAKLQIRSTPLDEVGRIDVVPDVPGLIIAVTPLAETSWGKLAKPCAHAGQRAWMRSDPDGRVHRDSRSDGRGLVVGAVLTGLDRTGPGAQELVMPACSFSRTLSRLKLAGSWRAGNSTSVWRCSATKLCAGTKRNAWSRIQSK